MGINKTIALTLGALLALSSCTYSAKASRDQCRVDNEIQAQMQSTEAGNLYFYNLHDAMPEDKYQKVIDIVVDNFSLASIEFKDVKIVTGSFPKLEGLDIMMVAAHSNTYNEIGASFESENPYAMVKFSNGTFGINDNPSWGRYSFSRLKDIMGHPYTAEQVESHMGIFKVDPKASCQVPTINEIARTVTHEVAHGFGAAHIGGGFYSTEKGNYVVSKARCRPGYKFHTQNKEQMAEFIATVRGGQLSDSEAINLRKMMVNRTIPYTSLPCQD
jgi:hypothetical protein